MNAVTTGCTAIVTSATAWKVPVVDVDVFEIDAFGHAVLLCPHLAAASGPVSGQVPVHECGRHIQRPDNKGMSVSAAPDPGTARRPGLVNSVKINNGSEAILPRQRVVIDRSRVAHQHQHRCGFAHHPGQRQSRPLIIPGSAVGTTTRHDGFHFGMPSA